MTEEYFPYFSNELNYLRTAGQDFANDHPGVAWALGLASQPSQDPHVERLLQGVAFLNARIQHRLDDDFPELVESLLNTLCPQYLSPFPSCAIVQMTLDATRIGDPSQGLTVTVPRGTSLEIQADASSPLLQFRTVFDTAVSPVAVSEARCYSQPINAPKNSRVNDAAAALSVQLSTTASGATWSTLNLPVLRFFLHGSPDVAHGLYDLLLRHVLQIVVRDPAAPGKELYLKPDVIRPVGFAADQALLPADARVLPGHRLLREYFAFPQKFHFVDVLLPPGQLAAFGERVELLFLLDREDAQLENSVRTESLRLGCAPIVNLFQRRAYPIDLQLRQTEYAVVPMDQMNSRCEIHSIDSVTSTTTTGVRATWRSFYDIFHPQAAESAGYWRVTRRRGTADSTDGPARWEAWLSLSDLDFQPDQTENRQVHVEATCTNMDWPNLLTWSPRSAGPELQLHGFNEISRVRLITRPTPSRRWTRRQGWRWRLLSQLSLNHLSLLDSPQGPDALREILNLYVDPDEPGMADRLAGLKSIQYRRVAGRVGRGPSAIARGLEVTLSVDEGAFPSGDLLLFATVLREFLGNYTTINSFVETIVRTTQVPDREWHRWPPLAGTRSLV